MPKSKLKIVVIDVDETLGYFAQFGMFCHALDSYFHDQNYHYNHFNQLLDLFPNLLRPNILTILQFLLHKKEKGICHGIMIYTNNQGPKPWVEHIKSYFEHKLGKKVFDQVIAAFKVNGKIIEVCRTTDKKTYEDLLNCIKLPNNVEVCFLDDQLHPEMEHDNVYYINLKPYIFSMSFDSMIQSFLQSSLANSINKDDFQQKMKIYLNNYHYIASPKSQKEQDIDVIISKKIIDHLKEFFSNFSGSKNK